MYTLPSHVARYNLHCVAAILPDVNLIMFPVFNREQFVVPAKQCLLGQRLFEIVCSIKLHAYNSLHIVRNVFRNAVGRHTQSPCN